MLTRLFRYIESWRPRPGVNCILSQTPYGITVSADTYAMWRHPWQVNAERGFDPDSTLPEWRAFVEPGLVNGNDVGILMRPDRVDGRKAEADLLIDLTDPDFRPYLLLNTWRAPQQSQGLRATLDGDIIALPGESFPPYFLRLGARPAAKGGNWMDPAATGPAKTPGQNRDLLATDIVLEIPRVASRQEVTVGDPTTQGQSITLSTVYDASYVRSGARMRLKTVAKWVPPEPVTAADRLLGLAQSSQMDELKIATVWALSPPDAEPVDQPDHNWAMYAQAFVFWNLAYVVRITDPTAPPDPIRLTTGLLGGMADMIFQGLLTANNDTAQQIAAFLSDTDDRGVFYSV